MTRAARLFAVAFILSFVFVWAALADPFLPSGGNPFLPSGGCGGAPSVGQAAGDPFGEPFLPTGAGCYVGPGDIVGFEAWYGNRAYTAAIAAAGTTAAANFERDSDAHTCDVLLGLSGLTTTSNCSTGGDNATAVSTWCAATTCRVTHWFDQTGNGFHQFQNTNAQRPIYNAGGFSGGRDCWTFDGSATNLQAQGLITAPNPYSVSAVYQSNITTAAVPREIIGGLFGTWQLFDHGTTLSSIDAGGAISNGSASRNFTISDGNPHGINYAANGASSVFNDDGNDIAFTTGVATNSQVLNIGWNGSNGANDWGGCIAEAGYSQGAFSAPQRASLWANQRAWYSLTANIGAGSYTGPGDAVVNSGVGYPFWGLRGYNQAWANGVNHGAVLRRASDNALKGIAIKTNGDLDVASAVAWAGTDATCTGSQTASATLVVTGCASGAIHVGDQISGSGVTNPTFITAIGTCGGGAGSCTTNQSQTYAASTITAAVATAVVALPDQQNGGVTAEQATSANQPGFLVNCANTTKPCMYLNSTAPLDMATATFAQAQPLTFDLVSERTGTFTALACILCQPTGGTFAETFYNSTTNTVGIYAGTTQTATASDSALHGFTEGFSGASSFVNVDGTSTTVNPGAGGLGASSTIGVQASGGANLDGYLDEFGVWSVLLSSGQQSTLHANISAYWGTP